LIAKHVGEVVHLISWADISSQPGRFMGRLVDGQIEELIILPIVEFVVGIRHPGNPREDSPGGP
jgi:hypothetical protein